MQLREFLQMNDAFAFKELDLSGNQLQLLKSASILELRKLGCITQVLYSREEKKESKKESKKDK